jgi:hypothetical protein
VCGCVGLGCAAGTPKNGNVEFASVQGRVGTSDTNHVVPRVPGAKNANAHRKRATTSTQVRASTAGGPFLHFRQKNHFCAPKRPRLRWPPRVRAWRAARLGFGPVFDFSHFSHFGGFDPRKRAHVRPAAPKHPKHAKTTKLPKNAKPPAASAREQARKNPCVCVCVCACVCARARAPAPRAPLPLVFRPGGGWALVTLITSSQGFLGPKPRHAG